MLPGFETFGFLAKPIATNVAFASHGLFPLPFNHDFFIQVGMARKKLHSGSL